jgi:DNA primase
VTQHVTEPTKSTSEQSAITPEQRAAIERHYDIAAPLMALDFPHAPLVTTWHPHGLATKPEFRQRWLVEVPDGVVKVEVTTKDSGTRPYVALTEPAVPWLVRQGAVGFMSWTPSPADPECVRYARILLGRCGRAGERELKMAMLGMRTQLLQFGFEAIPVLDGFKGAALFVPFGDVPLYPDVLDWANELCGAAVKRLPELLTIAKKDERGDRVHLSVHTNAVAASSELPYSLRGNLELTMVTPIEWTELEHAHNGKWTARNSAKRLERDVFAEQAAGIGVQLFGRVRSRQ